MAWLHFNLPLEASCLRPPGALQGQGRPRSPAGPTERITRCTTVGALSPRARTVSLPISVVLPPGHRQQLAGSLLSPGEAGGIE
ncbi:unnamed protein product [Lota lota]